jgi:hypothetical protein
LNSNLVYGQNSSYLVHYLAQNVAAGKVPKALASDVYRYNPIGPDDLALAVETSFARLSEAKGQRFNLNGKQGATLKDIISVLERSLGLNDGSTKSASLIPGVEFVEEFFVGITHDRNMIRFAKEFDANQPNLRANDFFEKFHLTHQNTLEKEYVEKHLQDGDLIHPISSNYKLSSLD